MKETVKKILKKIGMYEKVKYLVKDKRKLTKRYKFENRKKDYKKVCFVLAGYKEFAYDIVFERIKEFVPNDVEVCILSSGKYSEKLSKIAEENEWSYLSTKKNNVSLIQNVANKIFDQAEFIYKLDEDIFVTKGYFETLYKTYKKCEEDGEYRIGFVAPIIPINGFAHKLLLKRFNLEEIYKEKFEKPIYAAGRDRMIENNPDVARFMWGYEDYLPNIDEISKILSNDEFEYTICPIRFSIGAILYKREVWEEMGMLDVPRGSGLGLDEENICSLSIKGSKAMIISKNTAVGHLSFGNQNMPMKEYFEKNTDVFRIHKG